ncbi:4642_t:CDS:2 [Ambispora leptoticha]|uniref:4642_t:CDS:1 n=1 Tax=Ambispora leptoticha TaxID=144679 RepID=A0A9N8Z603_9GLOM|nr:4642_t:CDS:2 [Ambispora leptoticha]
MTSIKVTYQSTLRRFSLSSASWADLENKLRSLYSIPVTTPIQLSYTDDDGDVITLSSDLELEEVLSLQAQGTTYKFTLNTLPTSTPNSSTSSLGQESNGETWVMTERQREESVETVASDNETSDIRQGIQGIQIEDNATNNPFLQSSQSQQIEPKVMRQESVLQNPSPEPESRPPSYYHVNIADESDEVMLDSTSSKGKQKENVGETSASASASDSSTSNKNNEQRQDDRSPVMELAEQFQNLLDQFQDVLVQKPEIIETVNGIMDQILHAIPVDIEIWAEWLASHRPREQQQDRAPQSHEQEQSRGAFSFFPPGFPFHQGRHDSANMFTGNCPFIQPDTFPFNSRPWNPAHQKLLILHQMGYWEDDDQNIDLLKRYNGNLERVVEVLVQQVEENEKRPYNLQ